jgi:hypothetical protein
MSRRRFLSPVVWEGLWWGVTFAVAFMISETVLDPLDLNPLPKALIEFSIVYWLAALHATMMRHSKSRLRFCGRVFWGGILWAATFAVAFMISETVLDPLDLNPLPKAFIEFSIVYWLAILKDRVMGRKPKD